MKKVLLFFAIIFVTSLSAQNPICDGSRFLNPDFQVSTTLGVVFGNSTTFGGNNADLKMDIFEPSNDVATERPVIILAYGGSFISGAREDMHAFCNYYAERGYVCATIDYRLYDGAFFPFPDSLDFTDVVIKAVSDMKAAVRFFREDAATTNTYKVDQNLIFVGGISAGGIVASHVGFLDLSDPIQAYIDPILVANGGLEGNSSSNTQFSSDVAGVINFSGGIKDAAYIDPTDPPLFSVHDDGDDVVPYASGNAAVFGIDIIYMHGSALMHAQALQSNVSSELLTVSNSPAHVSYFQSTIGTDTVLNRSLEFLYPIVCSQLASVNVNNLDNFKFYPNPAEDYLKVDINSSNVSESRIVLYDMMGRIVLDEKLNGEKNTIRVSHLQSGSYRACIVNQDLIEQKSELIIIE